MFPHPPSAWAYHGLRRPRPLSRRSRGIGSSLFFRPGSCPFALGSLCRVHWAHWNPGLCVAHLDPATFAQATFRHVESHPLFPMLGLIGEILQGSNGWNSWIPSRYASDISGFGCLPKDPCGPCSQDASATVPKASTCRGQRVPRALHRALSKAPRLHSRGQRVKHPMVPTN